MKKSPILWNCNSQCTVTILTKGLFSEAMHQPQSLKRI